MNKCSKCGIRKSEENFSFKNKGLKLRHRQCKLCMRKTINIHYRQNTKYYLTKAAKRNWAIRANISKYIRSYLENNPCVDCGESDIIVLEFDHTGKERKTKAVSSLIRSRVSLDQIKKEISKCEIRCANCHRRKTAKMFNWYKLSSRPL